jgi:hypothetical protein
LSEKTAGVAFEIEVSAVTLETGIQLRSVLLSLNSRLDVPANAVIEPSVLRAWKNPRQAAGSALVNAPNDGNGP